VESNQRLRKSSDFDRISKFGRVLRVDSWLIIAYYSNDLGYFRWGATISKKVGNAVLRNKLKRWIKTYFRENEMGFNEGLDLNFIFKPQKDIYQSLNFKNFKLKLNPTLEKLKKNKNVH